MEQSKSSLPGIALVAGIFCIAAARAVVIDYVPVGNAGNAIDPTTGEGTVGYDYRIGKYEVTNAQYAEFLNAVARTDTYGLYNANMGSDANGGITRSGMSGSFTYAAKQNMGNKPVNWVSWYDAARFTNWLHNSQPTGLQTTLTTEDGAYALTGNTGLISKNGSATVWIPTGEEWYKAAYHDPTSGAGGGDNFWLYPTRSDSVPTVASAGANGDVSNPGSNLVNYVFGANWNGPDGNANVTTVGSAASASYYGTFDQGGNVWEWNDGIYPGATRGVRGGSFDDLDSDNVLQVSAGGDIDPSDEFDTLGFRVATVPEPGVPVLAVLAGGLLLRRRRG